MVHNVIEKHIRFNPRPHAGGDRDHQNAIAQILVSIHAPTRGATLEYQPLRRLYGVSIHAPTRGATR